MKGLSEKGGCVRHVEQNRLRRYNDDTGGATNQTFSNSYAFGNEKRNAIKLFQVGKQEKQPAKQDTPPV